MQSYGPNTTNVIYHSFGATPTVDPRFRGRIVFSGPTYNLTITMHHLQQADSGAYICMAVKNQRVWGSGTLVVVTGTKLTHPWDHSTYLLARPGFTCPSLGTFPLYLLEFLPA